MTRVFIPWSELLGNNPVVPLLDRANSVRRVACNVRALNPWLFHNLGFGALGIPNLTPAPVSQFYWNRLCPDVPIPPSNTSVSPPFIGGQCSVQYDVSFITRNRVTGNVTGGGPSPWGPITRCYARIEHVVNGGEIAGGYVQGPNFLGNQLFRSNISLGGTRGALEIVSISITRRDGLPDNCGNGANIVVVPPIPPSNVFNPTILFDGQIRPVTVTFPDLNTGNWPNFSLTPTLDIEGGRYEFLPDGISMDFNPPINLPAFGNAGGNQTTNIQNTVGDILDIVNNIEQNPPVPSSPSMSVALPFADCGSEPVVENISGELPTVLGLALSKIATNLDTIGTRICDNVAVVPEWWQVRPGQRSQLVIQFAGLNSNGSENRNRWSLIVPHYRYGESQPISLPIYEKGRFFASLTLDDNSKIWVNAKTQSKAIDYVRRLSLLVKPALLTNPLDIHSGERRGTALVEMRTRAVRASFFSTGQKNMSPDWVKSLR